MSQRSAKIRVWDLPIRIFHWLLVICVAGAFITAKIGGLQMDLHVLFGYAVLALLAFRIVWGFVGGKNARFTSFVRGPGTIVAYLKGRLPHRPGHNPLGALSVLAMLALLAYQAGLGLFSNDDFMTEGPLAGLVGKDMSDRLTGLHHLNYVPILVLVALHLAAITWYRLVKKQRLIEAMITGKAPASEFDDEDQRAR